MSNNVGTKYLKKYNFFGGGAGYACGIRPAHAAIASQYAARGY